jgi:8-oxo-dGTP diphosphatase
MTERVTDVAVAIFLKPDGRFLLATRPPGKPYPGYWEFPGGKIEPGESVRDALVRELVEELDVTITTAHPWFTFVMRYTHATVRLHCWRVLAWHGQMRGMEGQAFAWQSIDALSVAPTLPGCVPIFKALALPRTYWISNAAQMGEAAWLEALERALTRTAPGGALVQVREKTFSRQRLQTFAAEVVRLAHRAQCKVLVNGDADLARKVGADGVHWPAACLEANGARGDFALLGASAHSRAQIERAAAAGCDFCVVGPVCRTHSHPGVAGIGWERFAALACNAPLPVFAIGGLDATHNERAIQSGAHGLAMQRAIALDRAAPR